MPSLVERSPSNACNLVVCSCALPSNTVLVRSALPDPTDGRSAINLVYCRSSVNRKRFNDRRFRDFKRLRAFFTTKILSGIAPVSRFRARLCI
ncbi:MULTISPECIES: hypothetical protein [unclassified Microcoleus]|uniref:hypothetical protein n=1 Tax=unclassified Microcoleus TaxID=2642155 RepID=UPI002FD667FE